MVPALRHFQRLRLALAADPIDQPLLPVDPTRPPAGEIAAQRLGLARPAEGVAHAFLEERVEPGEHLRIFGLPVEIVLPGGPPEDQLHGSISACSSPSPASSPRTASSNRAAFAGERSR